MPTALGHASPPQLTAGPVVCLTHPPAPHFHKPHTHALLITLRTYRKWERGELHQQNHYGIFNFCETYGVAYEWLFGGIKHGDPPRFRLRLVS
jgi:hypothetical protein